MLQQCQINEVSFSLKFLTRKIDKNFENGAYSKLLFQVKVLSHFDRRVWVGYFFSITF